MSEHAGTSEAGPETERVAEEAATPMLVFRASSVWMAVNADRVVEVRGREVATPVPLAPPHIVGLINLRGQAVPLIDLAGFLGLPPPDSSDEVAEGFFDRTVVVTGAGMRVGMICDQVRGITPLAESSLRPVEVIQGERLREYGDAEVALGKEVLLVLSLDRLLEGARVPE